MGLTRPNYDETEEMKMAEERYGNLRVKKIRAAYNDLRAAVQAGDIERAQDAFDRYEQWADFVFDARHRCPNCATHQNSNRGETE